MHSLLSRANAVFAYTLSVLAGVTFCCFLTTAFEEYRAPVLIDTSRPLVKNLPDYTANRKNHDLGFLNFDVQVDLSPLFNWNVKQLFLYLVAEYPTSNNAVNQVVLWDKIVMRGDNPVVEVKASNPKYYFWDDGVGLKGNDNVTLSLSWNVIPNAGHLPLVPSGMAHRFSFPSEYTSGKLR